MVRERIKTIHHLREVSKYVDKNTLLLLDIDDTLIKSISKMSDPNLMFRTKLYNGNFRYYKKKFISYANAEYLQIVKDYNTLATGIVKYKLEHPLVPQLLDKWYTKSKHVWAFTSRGLEISKATRIMLEANAIKFRRFKKYKIEPGYNHSNQIVFDNPTGRSGTSHKHQMIFCGGYDKGTIMTQFLLAYMVGYYAYIDKIVMVDDQIHNLESCLEVLEDCKQLPNQVGELLKHVKFKGLHYVNNER